MDIYEIFESASIASISITAARAAEPTYSRPVLCPPSAAGEAAGRPRPGRPGGTVRLFTRVQAAATVKSAAQASDAGPRGPTWPGFTTTRRT